MSHDAVMVVKHLRLSEGKFCIHANWCSTLFFVDFLQNLIRFECYSGLFSAKIDLGSKFIFADSLQIESGWNVILMKSLLKLV